MSASRVAVRPSEEEVQDRKPLRVITWRGGFALGGLGGAPVAIVATLGFAIAALGGWGALILVAVAALAGGLMAWLYSEMGAMYPDEAGGMCRYAQISWRRYFSPAGAMATFGYWFAWSTSLSVFGLSIGGLIQTQWFATATWKLNIGIATIGLPQIIAIGAVLVVWLVNILGIRISVRVAYAVGALFLIPLVLFMVAPLTGAWNSALLVNNLDAAAAGVSGGVIVVALVWLYVLQWSTNAIEAVVTFTPEYVNPVKDLKRVVAVSVPVVVALFALSVLGLSGLVSVKQIGADPTGFYGTALHHLIGTGSGFAVALIVAALLLGMNTCTADGGRALYGMAKAHLTVNQFDYLNHHHVPSRAITLDLVLNVVLIVVLKSPIAILVAGNLGYLLAHLFALTGFMLLRKDRPNAVRPINTGAFGLGLAALLSVFVAATIAFGLTHSSITGYGGTKELLIGIGVLLFSLVAFAFRRIVQDKGQLHLQERSAVPDLVERKLAKPLT